MVNTTKASIYRPLNCMLEKRFSDCETAQGDTRKCTLKKLYLEKVVFSDWIKNLKCCFRYRAVCEKNIKLTEQNENLAMVIKKKEKEIAFGQYTR